MPWKVLKVDEQRQAFCYEIVALGKSVSAAAREAGVSRKTMSKWLRLYRQQPGCSLADRSRRPRHSPKRTCAATEAAVLGVRDAHRWGARKICKVLAGFGVEAPSIRTVTAVLGRHGRAGMAASSRNLRSRLWLTRRRDGLSARIPTVSGRWTIRGRWRSA